MKMNAPKQYVIKVSSPALGGGSYGGSGGYEIEEFDTLEEAETSINDWRARSTMDEFRLWDRVARRDRA